MSWHKEIFYETDFLKDFHKTWSQESRFIVYAIMKEKQISLLEAIKIFIYGEKTYDKKQDE